jgi:hypothetical protein
MHEKNVARKLDGAVCNLKKGVPDERIFGKKKPR